MAERDQAQEEPWKPSLNPGVELVGLPLTPEEGFIASRIDGGTDLHGLSVLTGFSAERIEAALEKLVSLGAVSRPEAADESEPSSTDELAGTGRKLYEAALHDLPAAERAARAKAAEDPELSAFCFDPLPAVVHALLENPRFGLVQARLVASHHSTPPGLDALGEFDEKLFLFCDV